VVRNHEGGTLDGNWRSRPEGGEPRSNAEFERRSNAEQERRGNAVFGPPGVGLLDSNDGGAIFGQPHERKPGFAAGSQGPERVGKVGAKVRRVARTITKVLVSGPVEGPRGPKHGNVLQGRGGQQ
jgi:hypothetical protein